MTTTPPPVSDGPRPDLVDRFTTWLLPDRSPVFGDERDRLHWYEATYLVAGVQWYLLPWALAVMAWVAPPEAAPYIAVLYGLFLLPFPLINIHVARRRVQIKDSDVRSRYVVLGTLLFWLPLPVILLGLTVGLDIRTGTSLETIKEASISALVWGATASAAAVAVVLLVAAVSRRRSRHAPAAVGDAAYDDE